jgi:hypothetical protein
LTTVPYSAIHSSEIEAEPADFALLQQDRNARPKHFRNNFEECIFIFTVMMATGSTNFLQGAVVTIAAIIGRSFDMTAAEIAWIGAALGYSTTSNGDPR